MKYPIKKTLKHTISLLLLTSVLTACNGVDTKPVDNRTKAEKFRDEKGSFFGFGEALGGKKKDTGARIGVNAYLWRGALDTLSVNPLDKIDVKNGVIQTEWVAVSPTKQVRIGTVIISSSLKVDALRVNVYKRIKENDVWVNVKVGRETTNKISNAILQRARELRLAEES